MLSTRSQTANGLHGAPDFCVERHVPIGSANERGRSIAVDGGAINPAVAEIIKMRVHTANVDARRIIELIVQGAAEPPALPLVPVSAKIGTAVGGEVTCFGARRGAVARITLDGLRGGLDIVDTAAVVIVGAPEEHAQPLFRAKTSADRATILAIVASSDDRVITA